MTGYQLTQAVKNKWHVNHVTIEAAAPRRGNRLTRGAAQLILALFGWRLEGTMPDLPKLMLIGAPHTSNWDWVLGMVVIWALGLRVYWLGKHTVFGWPAGIFLRWLGGVPVNRRGTQGVVAKTVAEYEQRDKFWLTILPTGTRTRGAVWKTGFYHIAQGAEIPILPFKFDYGHRIIYFGPLFHLSDDITADIDELQSLFVGVRGKNTLDAA